MPYSKELRFPLIRQELLTAHNGKIWHTCIPNWSDPILGMLKELLTPKPGFIIFEKRQNKIGE